MGFEEGFDLDPGAAEEGAVVAPEDEVVHVTDVGGAGEGFFDESVERSKVVVGEVLAGEVADGEAPAQEAQGCRRRREESLILHSVLRVRWPKFRTRFEPPHVGSYRMIFGRSGRG